MKKTWLYLTIFFLVLTTGIVLLRRELSGVYQLPLDGEITDGFGPRNSPVPGASTYHKGIDIAAKINTSIKAKTAGKVVDIYTHESGGKSLVIERPNGWREGYAHLNGYGKFKVGDTFKKGDLLAYTGATGNVSGPHLHYTLTDPQGNKRDPLLYVGKKLV